jgi:predicted secreted protein
MPRLLGLLVVAFAACLSLPARAGDPAALEILGFSANGGVFAFEEYGVSDGSGFPYANRFYLDTAKDAFLPGTPVRVMLENDAATVDQARAEARKRGQAVIADSVLSANKGFTAGANAITEISADPHHMAVVPTPYFSPFDKPLDLRLEVFELPGSDFCKTQGETFGFRLIYAVLESELPAIVMHEDKRIPESRGCANDYRIGAVQTFFPEGGEGVFAVILSVAAYGFEGPDRRWIAIPGKIRQ